RGGELETERAHRSHCGLGAADRGGRSVERREEAVACRVAFVAPEPASSRRTAAWCCASKSRHCLFPSRDAWVVEFTMSVKRSVVRTLSGTAGAVSPPTKRSSSSAMSKDVNRPQ